MNKADATAPTGLTATYGDTLAKVTLPEGWEQIVKDLEQQAQMVDLTRKHYIKYREQKRLDVPLWKDDYLK